MVIIDEMIIKDKCKETVKLLEKKLKNPPTNPVLLAAHERIKQNVYSYIMEINDVLSMLKYCELDIVLVDKKGLKKEKSKACFYELDDEFDFVEIWLLSDYNQETETERDYYAGYLKPLSAL